MLVPVAESEMKFAKKPFLDPQPPLGRARLGAELRKRSASLRLSAFKLKMGPVPGDESSRRKPWATSQLRA